MTVRAKDNDWRTLELIEQDDAGEAVRSQLPHEAEAILIPGYLLFRGLPEREAKRLERHPLVRQVLKGRVSHSEAKAIEQALIHAVPPPPVVEIGDSCTLTEGPAAGLPCVVTEVAGDQVVVRVESKSREIVLTVPVAHISLGVPAA